MSSDKLSCSSCYTDIDTGEEVVILTRNNMLDFDEGWSGVIVHKRCAKNLNWDEREATP